MLLRKRLASLRVWKRLTELERHIGNTNRGFVRTAEKVGTLGDALRSLAVCDGCGMVVSAGHKQTARFKLEGTGELVHACRFCAVEVKRRIKQRGRRSARA